MLISWGPVQITTQSVFLIIAVLVTAFSFWRKTREEHYEETEVFDVFLMALLLGVIAARVGFVIVHFQRFGFNVWQWFQFGAYPGWSLFAGVAGATWYLYRAATKKKWDGFELLDYWIIAVCFGLSWFWLGSLLAGSHVGTKTELPWGVVFPGVFEKHHPTQLYLLVGYLIVGGWLSRLEYRYRTFAWYRGSRNAAQTGFLFSTFLICFGLFQTMLCFVKPADWMLAGVRLDQVLGAVTFILGLGLLWYRSGRRISWKRRHATT